MTVEATGGFRALDLPGEREHALGVAVMPKVRADELSAALALGNDLTNIGVIEHLDDRAGPVPGPRAVPPS